MATHAIMVRRAHTSGLWKLRDCPRMAVSAVSRRRLGHLALGASAAAMLAGATTFSYEKTFATEAKKNVPVFTKDESGISYYDVKAGTGAGPVDGDFVIVDYVS